MLKNAYLGAKIGFDTAANELSKVGCAASYQLYLYLLSGTQYYIFTLNQNIKSNLHPIIKIPEGLTTAEGGRARPITVSR